MKNIDHHVYLLCDPATHQVRYVGCSANVEVRVKIHRGAKSDVGKWLRSLELPPVISVIETLPSSDAGFARERQVIASYVQSGACLLNRNVGFGRSRVNRKTTSRKSMAAKVAAGVCIACESPLKRRPVRGLCALCYSQARVEIRLRPTLERRFVLAGLLLPKRKNGFKSHLAAGR